MYLDRLYELSYASLNYRFADCSSFIGKWRSVGL